MFNDGSINFRPVIFERRNTMRWNRNTSVGRIFILIFIIKLNQENSNKAYISQIRDSRKYNCTGFSLHFLKLFTRVSQKGILFSNIFYFKISFLEFLIKDFTKELSSYHICISLSRLVDRLDFPLVLFWMRELLRRF